MEEIGNIKSFRNNLMFISVINILIFIFSDNITKFNIFGLIEITNINSKKVLIILLIVNIYVFYRYYTYFIKMHFNLNYVLLFKLILEKINSKKINGKIFINNSENERKIFLNSNGDIIYIEEGFNRGSDIFKNILSNKKVDCYLRSNKEIILVCENSNIRIELEKAYKGIFLFYILEKNMADYYLPFILGIISIELLVIKITYLLLN